MSFPKVLALITLLLFGIIAIVAVFKDDSKPSEQPSLTSTAPIEIQLDREKQAIVPAIVQQKPATAQMQVQTQTPKQSPAAPVQMQTPVAVQTPAPKPPVVAPAPAPVEPVTPPPAPQKTASPTPTADLPEANRINELFQTEGKKHPIVETITYKSRVNWLKGRQAWLSDYASQYQTSRHFIARSLHGKPDYFKQDLAEGDKFNVLRKDKNLQFHLVVDLSRCKMWLYYFDETANQRGLLKTYRVGLGRIDSAKPSGMLTPIGKYTLGNKIAIYKPKMMGYHNAERVEMINVFGSRWIPFDKEVGKCTAPAKGFGIHGVPWTTNAKGDRSQDLTSLGKYQSDGCVRLASEDIEEIFSIIITKPTTIELVKDFSDAQLPGQEKN